MFVMLPGALPFECHFVTTIVHLVQFSFMLLSKFELLIFIMLNYNIVCCVSVTIIPMLKWKFSSPLYKVGIGFPL